MNLSSFPVKHPSLITALVLLILALGLASMNRSGVDLFPDVTIPVVVITTVYPGAGPEEVEDQISRRLEDEVSSINGLKRVTSNNYEGYSVVVAEFNMGTDVKYAEQQVRNHTELVRNFFPQGAKDPVIVRFDPADQPIMRLALFGELSQVDLYDLAEQVVKPELARVEDVGKIGIVGGTKREIQVQIDRRKINEYRIPALAIANQLRNAGRNIPVGSVEKQSLEKNFRLEGQFHNLKDIERTLISYGGDLNGVQVKDLGRVVDTLKDVETLGYLYGPPPGTSGPTGLMARLKNVVGPGPERPPSERRPALFVDIYKRSGANTVAVAEGVAHRLEGLNHTLARREGKPFLSIVRDGSRIIRLNIEDVGESIAIGIFLAVLVVYFFLGNIRSTIITGIALPNSLIGAFILMFAMGFTINVMTLLALSLAVGLLVDDAIVVRENIFRKLEEGYSPRDAAVRGTNEVALAVIATSLTIISVFLPVGFLSGIVGQFFKQFGLTVVFAMLISLFDGLMVAPMLSAYFSGNVRAKKTRIVRLFDRFQDWQDRSYERVLRISLAHPLIVLLLASAVLITSFLALSRVKKTFLPARDDGEFMVTLELPPGTNVQATSSSALKMEERIRSISEVETIATVIGNAEGEKNKAILAVKLVPFASRSASTTEVKEHLRDLLQAEFADLNPKVTDYGVVGENRFPFVLNLRGQDLHVLEDYGVQLLGKMREIRDRDGRPVLADVDISSRPGKPDFKVRIDPERAKLVGITTGMAGLELRYLVSGEQVATFHEKDIEYDVTIRALPEQRNLEEQFSQLQVPNVQYRMIPLRSVATGKNEQSSAMIFRQDRARVVQITANLAPAGALQTAVDEATRIVGENPPPSGVSHSFVGQSEDLKELVSSILLAMGIAILMIYLILASLYDSFVTPLTILVAIPPALSGAFFALLATDKTLDIFSMIGSVMLVGLVVKNSILLVDHAMHEIRRGVDRKTAIYNGGITRLRPILMTTIAMIAGILPVALGLGEVSKLRASMGIAIIGGLVISTAVTLVVVPAMFEYVDRLRVFVEGLLESQGHSSKGE